MGESSIIILENSQFLGNIPYSPPYMKEISTIILENSQFL